LRPQLGILHQVGASDLILPKYQLKTQTYTPNTDERPGFIMYDELFERNYGIFERREQERIRDARVVIIGCGGIGGVVAISLARSGLGQFVLIEYDRFQPSNMNRQITCCSDTLGVNKAVTVRDSILKINSQANVTLIERALEPDEIDDVIELGDVIMPAADDWALSIITLDRAKERGKPSVMAYPVGALGRVCTFLPESPYAAECLVMPYKFPYERLKKFTDDPNNRRILQYYCTEGEWTQEWFDGWCEGNLPHAQLCTIVWITASLAAMEILKLVSEKWEPVAAPRYWHITPEGARIARFGYTRRILSRIVRRKWGQALLPAMAKRPRLIRLFTRLIS
jgi:molybdopterin/thiamine biosynthesis adenylyltransferase